MKKKIIIGLSFLSAVSLIAAIAAPVAIQNSHNTKIVSINDTAAKSIRLTDAGTNFFKDGTASDLVTIQSETDAKKAEWTTLFEVINGNGDIINDAITSIESVTVKADADAKMFKADLELTWNSGLEVLPTIMTGIELKPFEEVTLVYGSDDNIKLLIQSFIWESKVTYTTEEQLNQFFVDLEKNLNTESSGEQTLEQILTQSETVDYAASVESMKFKVTKFESDLFNLEIEFIGKSELTIANSKKVLENITLAMPQDEVIYKMSDALMAELIEEKVKMYLFTNSSEFEDVLNSNKGTLLPLLIVNLASFNNDTFEFTVANGSAEKLYDITMNFQLTIPGSTPESEPTIEIVSKTLVDVRDLK